ncbi:MAG: T9SS type A sorting domain-containing protein [Bacteroidetes bacterium]|nr:T9SS type A sorting domain-containing protein [Bacteroidota bacterium]
MITIEATSFDHIGSKFLTFASNSTGDLGIISINTSNGNIEQSYLSPNNEMLKFESGFNMIYAMMMPLGGGDFQFMAVDLAAGAETLIKTYTSAEINDFHPYISTFDLVNNRYIMPIFDAANNEKIVSINASNGNIEATFQTISLDGFAIEAGLEVTPPVGITKSQLKDIDIRIYPNPATDEIRIKNQEQFSHIEIQNFLAVTVLSERISTSPINVSNLPSGLYSVRVSNKIGSYSQSFIKK